MKTELVRFKERKQRSEFVAKRFNQYLKGQVADIGCFEAPLRNILTDCEYTGVDIVGAPDIQLNLDTSEPLPFHSDQFDCVLCIEVLEHLENLHSVFDELVRVSKQYIIISLPNCWRDARVKIEKGRGSFLHYGLPFDKPVDRHKWFFNCQQAEDFFRYQAKAHNLDIKEIFVTEKPKTFLLRQIRKFFYPGIRYNNRYANSVWVVYEKKTER